MPNNVCQEISLINISFIRKSWITKHSEGKTGIYRLNLRDGVVLDSPKSRILKRGLR